MWVMVVGVGLKQDVWEDVIVVTFFIMDTGRMLLYVSAPSTLGDDCVPYVSLTNKEHSATRFLHVFASLY